MPFVEVHWYEGRSDEQKAEIAKRIEQALIEVAGVPPDHCWIKFSDSSKTDFLINPTGRVTPVGQAASPRAGEASVRPRP